MKLSILTTISNPEKRQDPYIEALQCYNDLADEVVIVDGSEYCRYNPSNKKEKIICSYWPHSWSWEQLPKQLNAGLEQCTGDWVLKLDIDQFIHENDFKELRNRLENLDNPTATFQKYNVSYGKKFYQKGEMIVAINKKKYGDKIGFGEDKEIYTDLCRPIWKDRQEVVSENMSGRTGVNIWNFDYTFKTVQIARDEFYRFSLAHRNYFGYTQWGETIDSSFEVFKNLHASRHKKCNYEITNFDILPKYIRERYKNIKPEEMGYNGWSIL